MQQSINYAQIAPGVLEAMLGLETYVRRSRIDCGLLELVKTRVSQINGCAYCIDMHTKDARANGEAEHRLYGLQVWRETPFFSAKERGGAVLGRIVDENCGRRHPAGIDGRNVEILQ